MIKQRIFLLPGFAEDAFIFDEIKNSLSDYELVFVDYRKTLDFFSTIKDIDIWEFSKKLIENYSIGKNDLLIGHSMGGYFSFAIRELIHTEICMIASFNDQQKIFRITQNKSLTVFVAKSGFLCTKLGQYIMKKPGKGTYLEKVNDAVITNLKTFTNSQIGKMVTLSFGTKLKSEKENPLRIHAKNDKVVRIPDEAFYEVKLGHFCLMLEPEEVLKPIQNWLNENKY